MIASLGRPGWQTVTGYGNARVGRDRDGPRQGAHRRAAALTRHCRTAHQSRGRRGNAVQDAWIAMAARRHTARLVTFDRDFARLLDRHEYTLLTPQH